MKQNILVRLFTYQHRYGLGYIIFLVLLLGVLAISFSIPGELTNLEQRSAIESARFSLTDPATKSIVDLPYHLLQKASLHFFGITTFAIKLPSLVIAAFIGIGIIWLLRRWLLRNSIALFASIIAITSSQFIVAASTGTALIMPIFWMVAFLLLALKISAGPQSIWWWICIAIVGGLSLYTPLSIYLILSILLATLLHPHLRHLLKHAPKKHIFVALFIVIIVIAPLIFAITKHPEHLKTLLGWPVSGVSFGILKFNLIELAKNYLAFWKPDITIIGLAPLFGAASFALIILGGLKLIADHHAARSYGLALLVPLLLIVVVLQPLFAGILFVPFVLLLAIGIEALLDEWYKLFPHNPYARVVALIPVILLLTSITFGNLGYYMDAYRYSPSLPRFYTRDLDIMHDVLKKYPSATLVTTANQQAFFDLLRRDYPLMNTSQDVPVNISKKQPIIIGTGTGIDTNNFKGLLYIATDQYSERAPRFYVFAAHAR